MSVIPVGILSLPLYYLRETIAACETFQTWTGSANAEEALEFIFPVTTTSTTFPLCVIDWDENFSRLKIAGGSRNFFSQKGDLVIVFQNAVDTEMTEADNAFEFMNNVGNIISEMEEIAGVAGYLDIEKMSLQSGPERPKDEEVASTELDFYQAVFLIEYSGA